MYVLGLATDYDGTIALGGKVDSPTIDALRRLKETGRRLLLVTGRELRHLEQVFPELELFDRIVAENGGVVFDPATREERTLAEGPPQALVRELAAKRVEPLSVGRCIVATWSPHETTVLEAIRDLGLEHQIIFNKGAVMVMPPGINKASGLSAALGELGLSHHNVVGVGDAENDYAFLRACGCSAAVGNALPMLKEAADVVLRAPAGEGVAELVERICAADAGIIPARKHGILAGTSLNGDEVLLEPHAGSVLISGSSGIGKSTLATALTEKMAEKEFAFCVFDPEGDYEGLENAVAVGDTGTPPTKKEALDLLSKAESNVVVDTQALEVADRPSFFLNLLPEVLALRARSGRPHWLVIDEAHHLLPARRSDVADVFPLDLSGGLLVTVHPEAVAFEALRNVRSVLALGPQAADALAAYCKSVGAKAPSVPRHPGDDEALLYQRGEVQIIRVERPRQVHKRHLRKYAEGQLGPDQSFYFRGPEKSLNLRAHNILMFNEIATGLDERTWEHHRNAGDYSTWLRDVIKNEPLAQEVAEIERDRQLGPQQARDRIVEAISRRYTLPS